MATALKKMATEVRMATMCHFHLFVKFLLEGSPGSSHSSSESNPWVAHVLQLLSHSGHLRYSRNGCQDQTRLTQFPHLGRSSCKTGERRFKAGDEAPVYRIQQWYMVAGCRCDAGWLLLTLRLTPSSAHGIVLLLLPRLPESATWLFRTRPQSLVNGFSNTWH